MILAIGRIERALSRIEMALDSIPANGSDNGLERRHDRLKEEMQRAIETVDNLISSHGQ